MLGLSCGRVSVSGVLVSGALESVPPGGPTSPGPTPLSPRLLAVQVRVKSSFRRIFEVFEDGQEQGVDAEHGRV